LPIKSKSTTESVDQGSTDLELEFDKADIFSQADIAEKTIGNATCE
jgi:hypothetical protein